MSRTNQDSPGGATAGPSAPVEPRSTSVGILATALWVALLTGLLELALIFFFKRLRDPSPGLFRMNRHLLWMVPTVNFALIGGAGLAARLLAFVSPRVVSRIALRVVVFLGFLTLLTTYPRLFLWANVLLAAGFSLRFSNRLERNPDAFRRIVRRSLPALAVASLGVAGFSFHRDVISADRGATVDSKTQAKRPNVLIVVLDTVRADRLSLYGYDRPTTPRLDRFARRGVVFEHARTTAPWTLPAHASLMTGLWPHQLSADINGPLDDAHPTLAEFLGSRGYDTFGVVANLTYTGAETGLNRGFSSYRDHDVSALGALRTSTFGKEVVWPLLTLGRAVDHRDALLYRKDAAEVNRQFLERLDAVAGDRPFFAFLNYFDAHDPYVPPPGYEGRFGEAPASRADKRLFYEWFIRDKNTLTRRETRLVKDAYDDCLAYLDEQVGRLMDELDRRGVLDDTLVVVTADHGEHFGAHGLFGHASSLYAQETWVPLIVVPPKNQNVSARRIGDDAVSTRDVARTVVDLLGLDAEAPFPGRSLAELWRSPARGNDSESVLTTVDEPVAAAPNQGRSPVFRGPMQSIVLDDHVYIRNGDGVEELYHFPTDKKELRNLTDDAAAAPMLERSRERLSKLLADEPRPGAGR